MRPRRVDNAPYFAALVVSSCNTIDKGTTARAGNRIAGPEMLTRLSSADR